MSDSNKELERKNEQTQEANQTDNTGLENASGNTDGTAGDPPAASSGKKRSKGDIVRYIIMAVAACVFVFAAVQIVRIVRNYKHSQDIYNDIESQAYATQDDSDNVAPTDPAINEEYPGINANARIDFEVLKSINSQVVGWVEVPSVGISYPVVQGEDNDYYLDHAFNDEFSWSGAIFLDWRNSPSFDDPHTVIYGHHMNDGSMFASLLEYDSEDFYREQAENNNNYFYIYLENEVQVYQIFSVCDVTFDDNRDTFRLVSDSFSLQDYLDAINAVKLYDTGITADTDDIVTTLYTCQNGSSNPERHMVHGKLITTIGR